MSIKAIETVYNGYRFRSRLEARWAVFFDALNIHYEYEPEGFELGKKSQFLYVSPEEEDTELGRYLPDFWLPQVEMWAEVKARPFTSLEHEKCEALAKGSGYACLMLDGPPATRNYWAYECGYGAENEYEEADYLLSVGRYWENEGRFYSHTGLSPFEVQDFYYQIDDCPGVLAARQARFEHGESPRRG